MKEDLTILFVVVAIVLLVLFICYLKKDHTTPEAMKLAGKRFLGIKLPDLLIALLVVALVLVLVASSRGGPGKVSLVLSHWHKLIEGLQESPKRVYNLLEGAIYLREMEGVTTYRVVYPEGGIFSARREYLRVQRSEHLFDVCAAPFGNGFFFSWWLGEAPGCLFTLPFIGPLLTWLFRPATYYRLDTALMFQDAVHSAVLEVIDRLTQAKGLRALSELERKPIMSDLFKRK